MFTGKRSKKKREDLFKYYIDQVCDITEMLEKEGHSRAECRYKEVMAIILLLILDSLRVCRTYLCILIGALFAHLLSGVLVL